MAKSRVTGGYVGNAVETAGESEGSGTPGPIDTEITVSEDSSFPTKKSISLNSSRRRCGAFGATVQAVTLSKLSPVEKRNLAQRLRSELEQVQLLQKRIDLQRLNGVTLSSSSDILSCSNGSNVHPVENLRKTSVSSHVPANKSKLIGKNNKPRGWNRGSTGKFATAACTSSPSHANALLMKDCESLLKRLMGHQYGWVFNTPVDVVKLNIPDYFSIIKHPMDFGTIKSKMEKGSYSGPLEFASDVRLTLSNAMTYNPPGNDVYVMADTINKVFEGRWKTIEKKLPRSDVLPLPRKTDPCQDVKTTRPVPPSKKRKIASLPPQPEVIPPAKPSGQEKHDLGQQLELLMGEMPVHIIDFLKEHSSNGRECGEDETEIDIDDLSDDTLFTLRKLLDEFFQDKLKNIEKVAVCEIEVLNDSGPSNSSLQPVKGNDPADEEMDIGGNEPPVSSYPHAKVEKDTTCRMNKRPSPRSSNYSNSTSSSDSESIDVEACPTNGTKVPENLGSEAQLDEKSKAGDSLERNKSISSLDQLEDNSQYKPSSFDSDCCQDGDSGPTERHVSPEKLYRVAILKNRFVDTILKAREKTLTQGEKGDPEKLRQEREKLEMEQRKEKARLQAEAKAAEDARKQAEVEAAAEARRKRELEREAARQALMQMERTVEINENSRFLEDLEKLRAVPAEQLPSSADEISPDHSQDGLGSFKFGSRNPLEQLGLYMKSDEEEEEGEPPSVPNPANDVKEDSFPNPASDVENERESPYVPNPVNDVEEERKTQCVSNPVYGVEEKVEPPSAPSPINDLKEEREPPCVPNPDVEVEREPPHVPNPVYDVEEKGEPPSVRNPINDVKEEREPSCVPSEQLPSSADETSPDHSQDGLGSFKFGSSNPLEQLGLYMKVDDEEGEPPSIPNPVNNVKEDSFPNPASDVEEERDSPSVSNPVNDVKEGREPQCVPNPVYAVEEKAELPSIPSPINDVKMEREPPCVPNSDVEEEREQPRVPNPVYDVEEKGEPPFVPNPMNDVKEEKEPPCVPAEKLSSSAESHPINDVKKEREPPCVPNSDLDEEREQSSVPNPVYDVEEKGEPPSVPNPMNDVKEEREPPCAPAEQLSSSADETSPDHSQDGPGSFKLGSSNPLEQLGSNMKIDGEEEEGEPPSVPNPVNDVKVDSVPNPASDVEEERESPSVPNPVYGVEEKVELPSVPSPIDDVKEEREPPCVPDPVYDVEEGRKPPSVPNPVYDVEEKGEPPSVPNPTNDAKEERETPSVPISLNGVEDREPPCVPNPVYDVEEKVESSSVPNPINDVKEEIKPPSFPNPINYVEEERVSPFVPNPDVEEKVEPPSLPDPTNDVKEERKLPSDLNPVNDVEEEKEPPCVRNLVYGVEEKGGPSSVPNPTNDAKEKREPPSVPNPLNDKGEEREPSCVLNPNPNPVYGVEEKGELPSVPNPINDVKEEREPSSIQNLSNDVEENSIPYPVNDVEMEREPAYPVYDVEEREPPFAIPDPINDVHFKREPHSVTNPVDIVEDGEID